MAPKRLFLSFEGISVIFSCGNFTIENFNQIVTMWLTLQGSSQRSASCPNWITVVQCYRVLEGCPLNRFCLDTLFEYPWDCQSEKQSLCPIYKTYIIISLYHKQVFPDRRTDIWNLPIDTSCIFITVVSSSGAFVNINASSSSISLKPLFTCLNIFRSQTWKMHFCMKRCISGNSGIFFSKLIFFL